MYRKLYGKSRDYRSCNNRVLENLKNQLTKKVVGTSPSSHDAVDDVPGAPPEEAEVEVRTVQPLRRYGNRRERPRAAARDMAAMEDKLGEEDKKLLEEARSVEKENEERARVEAERLEKLKDEIILVEDIDEHLAENTEAHHTDLFDCADEQLVVRRGQEFKLTVTFKNRPYDREVDDLYLVFNIGDSPNVHKKTSARIKLRENDKTRYMTGKKRKWGARILSEDDKSMTLSVYTPPNAVIGDWEYGVRTRKGDEEFEFEAKQDMVLLLNPWCEDDEVYMEDASLLNEYILNQEGSVYYGSSSKVYNKAWNYGQFQKDILMISVTLLRMSNGGVVSARMGDPVYISRALSRIVNSSDDDGVLTGRWDGNYSDGVRPLSWTGSPAILKQYWESSCTPVRYGQCWVFSHVLTTVARCLGLPCRSVTNFSSAHDTDLSMTIDKYVNEEGDELDFYSGDSVWNFHVWNDVWMRRSDLDDAHGVNGKYDGWQAVDATPQELSARLYQCGPSPLAAIKLGEVNVTYDTKFVFGEVNAERCTWLVAEPLKLLKRDSHSVGKKMSTKVPDGEGFIKLRIWNQDEARLDVTHQYKHAEGSAAERDAVNRAVGEGRHAEMLTEDQTGIDIVVSEEDLPLAGEDFVLKFTTKNTGSEERKVTLEAIVRPANYWGSLLGKERIAHEKYKTVTLGPGDEKSEDITVRNEDYIRLCDDALAMRLLLSARVRDFKDPVVSSEDVVLEVPEIVVEGLPEETSVHNVYDVKVSYSNPLNKRLTKVELKIDGSIWVENDDLELKHAIYTKKIGVLEPKESQTTTLKCKPMKKPKHSKERTLTVTLASAEIADMVGRISTKLA